MSELVQEYLSSRQKSWFDKGARLREFKPGDSVLVLLPTSFNRFHVNMLKDFHVRENQGCFVDKYLNI